jgi:hypothetical protein
MKTIEISSRNLQPERPYALSRGAGFWELTFDGWQASFKHEEGASYAAWLLLHPPPKPIHAVALALDARTLSTQAPGATEVIYQRWLGLDEAETVRALRRQQHELEAVLDDDDAIESVKAEALRELEAIAEFQRQHPWRARDCAERCARAVSAAIRRLHDRLAGAVDAGGHPHLVLRAFAQHIDEHLLTASDGGGVPGWFRVGAALPGYFIYKAPPGVVWHGGYGLRSAARRPAAVVYLSRFLCAGFALALLATGCAGPRPLKGGKAVTTRKPAGVIEQTLVQGENPSQATKQDQESVKVRTYTLPVGSRIEQSQIWEGECPREPKVPGSTAESRARADACPPASAQPAAAFILSAPMPVVEREETHARTELGAAQKDTARELGAKLSSLKGIVWVGVGLFVFGIASLVWPPLKVIIGSVTTSAALMLGGLALMVLPTLVVGNELLILGVVVLAVGGWFLAHRHGQLRGMVAADAGAPKAGTPAGPNSPSQIPNSQ